MVISLGGSIMAPKEVDGVFIKNFKKLILSHKSHFIIVCGGGGIARSYQNNVKNLSNVSEDDLDWIGIMATRLNAELLRAVFGEAAYEKVVYGGKRMSTNKIVVAAGIKPGFSTDYSAVKFAELNGSYVINITNIDYVYDKDPSKYKDAKPLKELTWDEYNTRFGRSWKPGLNMPFDPIAAKLAKKNKIKVIVAGKDLVNIKRILEGKSFKGTLIKAH